MRSQGTYILGKVESDVCAGLGSRGEEMESTWVWFSTLLDEGFSNQLPRVHEMVAYYRATCEDGRGEGARHDFVTCHNPRQCRTNFVHRKTPASEAKS